MITITAKRTVLTLTRSIGLPPFWSYRCRWFFNGWLFHNGIGFDRLHFGILVVYNLVHCVESAAAKDFKTLSTKDKDGILRD